MSFLEKVYFVGFGLAATIIGGPLVGGVYALAALLLGPTEAKHYIAAGALLGVSPVTAAAIMIVGEEIEEAVGIDLPGIIAPILPSVQVCGGARIAITKALPASKPAWQLWAEARAREYAFST